MFPCIRDGSFPVHCVDTAEQIN